MNFAAAPTFGDEAASVITGGIGLIIICLGAILALAWLIFPFLVYHQLKQIHQVLLQILFQSKHANKLADAQTVHLQKIAEAFEGRRAEVEHRDS